MPQIVIQLEGFLTAWPIQYTDHRLVGTEFYSEVSIFFRRCSQLAYLFVESRHPWAKQGWCYCVFLFPVYTIHPIFDERKISKIIQHDNVRCILSLFYSYLSWSILLFRYTFIYGGQLVAISLSTIYELSTSVLHFEDKGLRVISKLCCNTLNNIIVLLGNKSFWLLPIGKSKYFTKR